MATFARISAGLDEDSTPRPLSLVPSGHVDHDPDAPLTDGSVRCLYRVVGPRELELLEQEGWTSVPRRASWSVIFFTFMELDDAIDVLTSRWSRRRLAIIEVPVDAAFAESARVELPDRLAGRVEYWVEADRLDDLNDHVRGPIRRVR